MRRIKQVWRTLNHVSTAVWIWGVGGSLVVTTGLGWAAQAQADMPAGWLALGSAGVAIISFMAVATGLTKLFPQWATGQERAAWQQLRDEATDAEYLQEKAQTELSEQTERNEKLLRENKGLVDERDLWKIKSEMLEREIERRKEELEIARAEAQPSLALSLPPESLNKELVIAIRTYGLPAYDALRDILDKMFEPIRDDPGLVKFFPGLFSQGPGQRIKETGNRLVERLAAPDSSEPFQPIWGLFQLTYFQELVFWVGRVNYFAPVNELGRQNLKDWFALHEKYIQRLKELGNAPDGQEIKSTMETLESTGGDTYTQRLVDAINSPTPDRSGSSS